MIKDVIKLVSFGFAFLMIAALAWSYLYEIFRDKKLRKQFLKKNSESIATDRPSSSPTAASAIDGGGSGIKTKSGLSEYLSLGKDVTITMCGNPINLTVDPIPEEASIKAKELSKALNQIITSGNAVVNEEKGFWKKTPLKINHRIIFPDISDATLKRMLEEAESNPDAPELIRQIMIKRRESLKDE